MPHQCVACGRVYPDQAGEIITGCSCKGRMFFYIKQECLDKAVKGASRPQLTKEERERIEQDVLSIVGEASERPIILDVEGVNVVKQGCYELDLANLFNGGAPVIYRLEDGKYHIDLPESFKKIGSKKAVAARKRHLERKG
jgi:predicted  nucleic acid-binding Zn-ribbon protein